MEVLCIAPETIKWAALRFLPNDLSKRHTTGCPSYNLWLTTSDTIQFALVTSLIYGVLPVMFVWGWARWGESPKLRTMPSLLSLLGFTLATTSATLAVSDLVYSHYHPKPRFAVFYPLLSNISRCGVLISFAGIVFSVMGVWKQNSLRWHAPVCALGTLTFWMMHTWFFTIVN